MACYVGPLAWTLRDGGCRAGDALAELTRERVQMVTRLRAVKLPGRSNRMFKSMRYEKVQCMWKTTNASIWLEKGYMWRYKSRTPEYGGEEICRVRRKRSTKIEILGNTHIQGVGIRRAPEKDREKAIIEEVISHTEKNTQSDRVAKLH